jgi:rhodanese-related sulfurtransferase
MKINQMAIYVKSFLIITTLLSAFACESQPSGNVSSVSEKKEVSGPVAQNIDVVTFKKFIEEKQGRQILDVRTPGETASGIIPGAIEMDISAANFPSSLDDLDKSKPVLVYCRSGNRSGQAMRQMSAMGFKEVYNLNGGIMAWSGSGQPLAQK